MKPFYLNGEIDDYIITAENGTTFVASEYFEISEFSQDDETDYILVILPRFTHFLVPLNKGKDKL